MTEPVDTRDKPPVKPIKTLVPRIKPKPPIETPDKPPVVVVRTDEPEQEETDNETDVQVGQVIKTATVTKKKYNKLSTFDNESITEEMTEISLTEESDAENELTSKKKKKKKKSEIPSIEDMTETMTQITDTVNETVNTVAKTAMVQILRQMVNSKQFTMVLAIGTVTLCLGYLLKIVFWK